MLQLIRTLVARQRGEHGASAVEYGLLVAGIAAVSVAAVFALGGTFTSAFQKSSNCVGADPYRAPAAGTPATC